LRVLIPTYEPGGLEARVYPHWRDSPTFTQVDVGEGCRVEGVKVHRLESDELIIDLVKREGIDCVIALSLSTRALELLTRVGVKVLTGSFSTVKEAIQLLCRRELYALKLEKVPASQVLP